MGLSARMHRASAITVGALVAVTSVALVAPVPVAAGTNSCSIQIKGKAKVYTSFGDAVAAAAPGKTLLLRGTCRTNPNYLAKDLTIKGIGEANKLTRGSLGRVLTIRDGAVVTLSNLVIRGGDTGLYGAGLVISDGAQVTLRDVTVTENKLSGTNLSGEGAGIWVGCPGPTTPTSLTMIRSTVSNNSIRTITSGRPAYGGGIFVGDCATATITNSTITGNRATALYASSLGGGIAVEGSATITHTTIVGNTASDGGSTSTAAKASGGGLWMRHAPDVTLQATIIAGNKAETGKACDTGTTSVVSNGYNLIDIGGDCDGFSDLDDDQVGTKANPIDPLLGGLGLNGGLTRSMLPKPASPAVDAIPDFYCTITSDQRQRERPTGDGCDIGAVER